MGFMQIIEFRTSAIDEVRKLDAPPVFHDLDVVQAVPSLS